MYKYQKGYIFNGHTFVVNKEDVHNATEDMFVDATALLPEPEVKTNGDRVRSMNDEEISEITNDWDFAIERHNT